MAQAHNLTVDECLALLKDVSLRPESIAEEMECAGVSRPLPADVQAARDAHEVADPAGSSGRARNGRRDFGASGDARPGRRPRRWTRLPAGSALRAGHVAQPGAGEGSQARAAEAEAARGPGTGAPPAGRAGAQAVARGRSARLLREQHRRLWRARGVVDATRPPGGGGGAGRALGPEGDPGRGRSRAVAPLLAGVRQAPPAAERDHHRRDSQGPRAPADRRRGVDGCAQRLFAAARLRGGAADPGAGSGGAATLAGALHRSARRAGAPARRRGAVRGPAVHGLDSRGRRSAPIRLARGRGGYQPSLHRPEAAPAGIRTGIRRRRPQLLHAPAARPVRQAAGGDGAYPRLRKAAGRGADGPGGGSGIGEGRDQPVLPRALHACAAGPPGAEDFPAAADDSIRAGDPVSAEPRHRNPIPTTDAIIAGPDGRIVLILRRNEPLGWALPGGFVDWGEELGAACRREAKEETGLDVELVTQFFTYSDPRRDPRRHTISTVYACRVPAGAEAKADDDAKDARWFSESEVPWRELCFDHAEILRDYFRWVHTGERRRI